MIPNIKSSEGGDGVLKKLYMRAQSLSCSACFKYVYPFKSSVREIVSNCLDSVTERNNSEKL
jgi:hypothetical protein